MALRVRDAAAAAAYQRALDRGASGLPTRVAVMEPNSPAIHGVGASPASWMWSALVHDQNPGGKPGTDPELKAPPAAADQNRCTMPDCTPLMLRPLISAGVV